METIDAHEGRRVRICDIPGDFLSVDMDKNVKMVLYGRLLELMVKILPQIYRQQMIYEKLMPVLYLTLNNSFYICLWHT